MSFLFRTSKYLTIAQLTGAWGPELARVRGEDPLQCQEDLTHVLLQTGAWMMLDRSGMIAVWDAWEWPVSRSITRLHAWRAVIFSISCEMRNPGAGSYMTS